MSTTSLSLLVRLRDPADELAWRRFVDLYTPLLKFWAGRFPLQGADAADLVQDVLTALLSALPRFESRPGVKFRGWLWTLTLNKYRERLRRQAARPVLADGAGALEEAYAPSPIPEIDEAEYRRYLVNRALQLMQSEFEPTTWRACWEFVVNARSAQDVAREFDLSVNAVYLAKSRVLRRLREELAGLLDE